MGKFKQTLLTEEAYSQLKETKELLSRIEGKRVSFTEIIKRMVSKQLVMLKLDTDVKNYITAFVSTISVILWTLGGSIPIASITAFNAISTAISSLYRAVL